MNTLLHILGADIPHHNHTLLQFFNDQLAASNPHARRFMLVTTQPDLASRYPALSLRCFSSQKALASALVKCASHDAQQRFFLHGQFNRYIWLRLLSGGLPASRISWHIWGADLYETAKGLKYRLFYRLRRLAQRRIGRVFATRGDLLQLAQRQPAMRGELLYFPSRLMATEGQHIAQQNPGAQNLPGSETFNLLVGNSGDASNQHIAALAAIHRQFQSDAWRDSRPLRLILPLGYPSHNQQYIQQLEQAAYQWFAAENICLLREKLAFNEYLSLLQRCDLGYFLFDRQQGVGTLSLLIQANIPCVLSRQNPFCHDMAEQQLPVLFSDQPLTPQQIQQARQQLISRDKSSIGFFYPAYLPLWQRALTLAAGGQP